MVKRNSLALLSLLLLAIYIWLRNTSWLTSSDEVLPLLITIPIAYMLLSPLSFKEQQKPFHVSLAIGGALLFFLGLISDLTLFLASGWALLTLSLLKEILSPDSFRRALSLSPLLIMAFPWVTLDAQSVGWYFRYTGAEVTAEILSLFGIDAVHQGTNIHLNGLDIFVEPACSGLNALQSMLIAGTTLAFFTLDNPKKVFYNIPTLLLSAWLANTLRIIVISSLAYLVSTDFVEGTFHSIIGWLSIVSVFLFAYFFFEQQKKIPSYKTFFLSLFLITFAAISSKELLSAWRTSPFDGQGWIALLIWMLPCFFYKERKEIPALVIASLVFTILGLVGALNAFCYIGLALSIAFINPNFTRSIPSYLWLALSFSWMPALGWALKDLGPEWVFYIRMTLSSIATLGVLL